MSVLTEVRTWIGTPYQHQASLKGMGCDCIGLVRGVWRAIYRAEPCNLPAYSPDWAEVGGADRLIEGLGACFEAVALEKVRPGDVIAFRMKPGAVAKHVAILSAGEGVGDPVAKIIHAYWGHAVVESWLGPFWRKCAVAAFRFPAVAPLRRGQAATPPHLRNGEEKQIRTHTTNAQVRVGPPPA